MDEEMRIMFAGLAMQGMLANSYTSIEFRPLSEATCCEIATGAVRQADALIKELEKPRKENE